MDSSANQDPPPQPNDLDGWRRAVTDGAFHTYAPESVVAAIQTLGASTDEAVLIPLAKHISKLILRFLRKNVSCYKRNRGLDIIYDTHADLWRSLMQPDSSDGKGLRTAFFARVQFRMRDAIVKDNRLSRAPAPQPLKDPAQRDDHKTHRVQYTEDLDAPDDSDEIRIVDEGIDVEAVLMKVPDDRKRLAFRLHMDGVPFKSTRSDSIANALGVSERTAREWVGEVKEFLKPLLGDKHDEQR